MCCSHAGYEGALCAVCSSGYYFTSATLTCSKCEASSINPFAAILLALFFVALACLGVAIYRKHNLWSDSEDKRDVSRKSLEDFFDSFLIALGILSPNTGLADRAVLRRKRRERAMAYKAKFKIYIAFYQILSSATFVLDLSYPLSFASLSYALGILNFNILEGVGSDCSLHLSYVHYLLVVTISPVAISICLWAIHHIHIYVITGCFVHFEAPMASKVQKVKDIYFGLFLLFSNLILPAVSVTIFRTFSCQDVDPDDVAIGSNVYMRADYSISCTSSRYMFARTWAKCMICIYPVGIPLLYFFLLFRTRELITHRKDYSLSNEEHDDGEHQSGNELSPLSPLQFLFDIYKPKFWYW